MIAISPPFWEKRGRLASPQWHASTTIGQVLTGKPLGREVECNGANSFRLSGSSRRPVGGSGMLKHFFSNLSPGVVAIFLAAGLFVAAVARGAETPATKNSSPKAASHLDEAAAKPSVEPAPHRVVEAAKEPASETPLSKPEKLRFQFRFQPWKDVLDWFAKQADLSLVADVVPPGTFNYSDTHEYTPTEAIDLLNSVLLTKGYTLIRRNRMLMLVNLEDGIPANLVSTVPVNSLDGRGEFEVVRVIFDLEKLKPEEVEGEIKKLLGPQARWCRWGNRGRSP